MKVSKRKDKDLSIIILHVRGDNYVSDSQTTVSVERCFYYGTPKCKVMQSFPFLITFKPGTDHVKK